MRLERTDGGDGGYMFVELEFVEDGGLACAVESELGVSH
jgi:hypothetical protein